MAWTATIKSKSIELPNAVHLRALAVEVEFRDGASVLTERYLFDNPTTAQLKARVKARLDALASVDLFAAALVVGSPVDVSETAPTAEELAKREFFAAYSKLQQLGQAAEKSGSKKADAEIAALKATVDDLYKAEYFG